MMSEFVIGTVCATLIAIASIGGAVYAGQQNNLKDRMFVTECLDNNGSVSYDDDYYMRCTLPSNPR